MPSRDICTVCFAPSPARARSAGISPVPPAEPHAGVEYLVTALALVTDQPLDSARELAHIAA